MECLEGYLPWYEGCDNPAKKRGEHSHEEEGRECSEEDGQLVVPHGEDCRDEEGLVPDLRHHTAQKFGGYDRRKCT